jgi:predicted nucleic acid-binding protein
MTAVVVSDAGPLIGLAWIGRVSVLTSLYGSVVIPDRVLTELHVDSDRTGARALPAALAAGAIRPQALRDGRAAELARLGLLLNAGEASAILLAEQTQCRFLLIDERRGRQIAGAPGVPVVSLAGVLLAAKRSGLLRCVASTLTDLTREGYRLSDALVSEVLRLAVDGEADSSG